MKRATIAAVLIGTALLWIYGHRYILAGLVCFAFYALGRLIKGRAI